MSTGVSTGVEVSFDKSELIVSKTDLRGNITYANRIFMRVSNFNEQALIGKNHNIIRHTDMPAGVFYGLWKSLKAEQEFLGFIKNSTADNNYYWVFANITPDYVNEKVVGFYSVRRFAPKAAVKIMEQHYRDMHVLERGANKQEAAKTSWQTMTDNIKQEHNMSYAEYVLSLYHNHLS